MPTGNILVGHPINAQDLLDELAARTGAWSSWTPAWTAATVNPVLNNGTITGRYWQVGKLVTAQCELIMGSSTTYGTGEYRFSVPVTAATGSFALASGSAFLYDDSTASNRRTGTVRFLNATTLLLYASNGEAAPAVPFTWANQDRVRFSITYEAA